MTRSAFSCRFLFALLLLVPVAASAAWRAEGPFVGTVTDVAFDPVAPDTVYAATSGGGVFRSDDGGSTWVLPGDGMTSREVHWVEVDPKLPSILWAGAGGPGEGGFWRSLDRGKSWAKVKVDATSTALGQPVAFAPGKPGVILEPSTNLHYRSGDGGRTWQGFRVPGQDAYAFAFDPKDPNVVWAGGRGETHHLSVSRDGGKTWKPCGEGLPEASVKLLRVASGSPATLYAVVGFGEIHRSTDGGKTFTELETGLGGTDEVWALEIDPFDLKTLLAATKKGMIVSPDAGETWLDAGASDASYLFRSVAFHPAKKGVVLAGAGGDGVYRSTDGGKTFTPLGTGLAAGWVKKLWASSAAPVPVYAQLGVGLFRMDAAGSWSEMRRPFATGEPAKVDGFVFDRAAPRTVYAHSSSTWYRSEDGGRVFTPVEMKGPSMKDMMKGNLTGPQFRSLVQDPGDPKVLYAGAWSNRDPGTAVFRTADGGKKWQPAGTGITSGGVDLLRAAGPGRLFAACGDDGVFRTTDGGKSWSAVRPGKVLDLAVDPSQPDRVYAGTKEGLYRSSDGGASWSRAAQGLKGDEVEAVVVAPDGQVFAGTFDGVFRSADGGATWKPMNDGLMNTDVRALAIAGGSPPRLYAGLGGGSVVSTELPAAP